MGEAIGKLACRQQYGEFNFNEGGTPDRWGALEAAFRGGSDEFNVGNVYVIPDHRVGGVLAGDNGILAAKVPPNGVGIGPTQQYMGVLRATLSPSGITPGQTYLAQWAETPTYWPGDAPLGLQTQVNRPKPWLDNFN